MTALRAMYGLRRVCLAATSLLLSASTIHLLNLPSEPAASHLSQGLYDLQAMSMNHRFAGRCVDIIRSLATKWHISLPEAAASLPPLRQINPRKGLSPVTSTFWGASIRRDDSGRSSGSSSGQQESPFPPPPSYGQQHVTSVPIANDLTAQLDSNEMQNFCWTPFPGQQMPVPLQQVLPSMAMDISGMDGISTQWDMFHGAGHLRQHSGPGQVDVSAPFQAWNWQ